MNVGEDLVVVGPCWIREIDSLAFGGGRVIKSGEEESTQVHSTSAGHTLEGVDPSLSNCW